MKSISTYDAVIIGSGMGGISAASLLAKDGNRVLVLEASHVPGGCSSSYKRKGYIFESGATTLIGFDEHQPLRWLENKLGITLPRWEISPSMAVHQGEHQITRWKDEEQWIAEASRVFGNPRGQRSFWELAGRLSKKVWKLSGENHYFPPTSVQDMLTLVKPSNLAYLPDLRFALESVAEIARRYDIYTTSFRQFLDEQLMITAQATAEETPFLFGAPALTYTNSANFYVPGGLLEMIRVFEDYIKKKGGHISCKEAVTGLHKQKDIYQIQTQKHIYKSPVVISNIPIWNMSEIATSDIKTYYNKLSEKYSRAWGAITMGVVTDNPYPSDLPLHNQLLLPNERQMPFTDANSIFVSMSHPKDKRRSPANKRILNVSCHTPAEQWFHLNGEYEYRKSELKSYILQTLKRHLPGFNKAEIEHAFLSTPVTWQNWVYRKYGRVGGLPQSMGKSLLDWPSSATPFEGLLQCGDTVFPGQGIPGVTLSGINAYHRATKKFE